MSDIDRIPSIGTMFIRGGYWYMVTGAPVAQTMRYDIINEHGTTCYSISPVDVWKSYGWMHLPAEDDTQ